MRQGSGQVGGLAASAEGRALLERLRCPACQGELTRAPARLICGAEGCGRVYPIRSGIPVLLPLLDEEHREIAEDSSHYYDEAAARFEELDSYWSNAYDEATWAMENQLVSEWIGDREPILDLGVGFYPHVESTADRLVVCADISLGSLLVARREYQERNPRMVHLCADAQRLPLASACLPAVVAGGELVNHLEPAVFFGELARVLQPGGRAVVSVAMKWCLDSLFAVLDASTGGHLGYSMTRAEVRRFLARPRSSCRVTWEVTPEADLVVSLLTRGHLLRLLRRVGLRPLDLRAQNVSSGLVPLPLQQRDGEGDPLDVATRVLLAADRAVFGRLPGLRWLGGNVYLVLER